MTLKQFAERYPKQYQFRIFDESGKCHSTLDRNEIVLLEYPVGEREVLTYFSTSPMNTLIFVKIK